MKSTERADAESIQTLSVLNPMARIDQHIMDDSDLAGPILFFLLFGFFLLFVCAVFFWDFYPSNMTSPTIADRTALLPPVRQSPFRLHIRASASRLNLPPFHHLAHVSADRSFDTSSNGSRAPRRRDGHSSWAFLQYSHLPTIGISPWILPSSPCIDVPCWRRSAHGHRIWLHHHYGCYSMVYGQ